MRPSNGRSERTRAGRPRSPGGSRRGFTLVETLVAVVISSVLLISIYQVLVTNQRVSAVQREQVLVQGTLRAGLDILAQEIRETSANGGDVTAAEGGRIAFRALRTFGIACAVSPPSLTVWTVTRQFRQGEWVYIFADGEPSTGQDDAWLEARVVDLPQSANCSGRPAQLLVFTSVSGGSMDDVNPGALVRSYREVEYRTGTFDGDVYLVREQDGTAARIVGPLDGQNGLEFGYLDANGNATTTPSAVRQVTITLRASSEARVTGTADPVDETLSTTVFLRN